MPLECVPEGELSIACVRGCGMVCIAGGKFGRKYSEEETAVDSADTV